MRPFKRQKGYARLYGSTGQSPCARALPATA